MSEYESICYENPPGIRPVWKHEKERMRDFIAATAVTVRRETLVTPDASPPLAAQHREIPLHSLLEYGSIFVAIICTLSLASWAVDIQPLMILSPFAALLVLVMSPFLFMMGRVARRK